MAQVQKQLIASQKFLSGLLALPQYGELRTKQLERLLAVIRKVRLTVEQSGLLLAAVDSSLWDEGSIGQLKSLVADQTVTETNETLVSQRVKQQDFTCLPYYLDGEWWRRLETAAPSEREKNCERLCQHAARLGLTNPTEETYAFLYVLAFALQPGTLIFDCEKLQLLTQWKPVMKRHLKNAVQPPLQPLLLPASVDECPKELLRSAYPQGFVAAFPAQTTVEEVMRLGRTWPLRKTNVVAAASKKGCYPGPLEGGNMVQAVAAATVQAVASQLATHVPKPKHASDSDVPGLKVLIPPTDQAVKETQLALMDKPNQPGASAHEKVDAAGLIDALQADLLQEKEPKAKQKLSMAAPKAKSKKETKKKETKEMAARRSAAKEPCKAVMKRPAGKGKLKRPAAASAAVRKRPAETAEQKQAKRARLFEQIPKKLQAAYMYGCTRCRGRSYCTLSCWGERGFTI